MTRAIGAWLVVLAVAPAVRAAEDPPNPPPAGVPLPATPAVTAESQLNEGLALARRQDWAAAERRYREAIRLRASFPEAWNGLGYALRKQGRYAESVQAYHEALRLRPSYPQALEYLGE